MAMFSELQLFEFSLLRILRIYLSSAAVVPWAWFGITSLILFLLVGLSICLVHFLMTYLVMEGGLSGVLRALLPLALAALIILSF